MTSHVRTVTRTVVRRDLRDIDPKVAVFAGIAIAADIVLVVLYATGRISGETLAAGIGPTGVGTLLAYARTSSHAELIHQADDAVRTALAVAPVVAEVAPAAAPAIETAEDILRVLEPELAPTGTDTPSTSTEPLQVAASR